MKQLIVYLLFTNIVTIVWVVKLAKENDILHNNNIGLEQLLVKEGLMTQEQFEKSLKK